MHRFQPTTEAKWLLMLAVLLAAGRAQADTPNRQAIAIRDNLEINSRGNASSVRQVPFPPELYAKLKEALFTPERVAQLIGLDVPDYLPSQGLQKVAHDGSHTIELRWTTQGLARMNEDQLWEVPLNGQQARIDAIQGRTVQLTVAGQGPAGPTVRTVQVLLPEGSKDVKLQNGRLAYRLAYPFLEGSRARARIKLETKPHLLGCMAKIYADPKFGFWAARMVTENTGDQRLRDYRVRFMVEGYSTGWSPWHECPEVVPGQTVVDAFFPLLDIDKIARLEEVRAVYLKAEYEYKNAEGKAFKDTKTVQLEILGHNLVEYSSKRVHDGMSFQERNDQAALILASMVTYQDPVIQQVAGRVCHHVGGAAAIYTREEAEKFLEGLYNFMATYISYQSPTAYMTPWGWRQHVMFGRDVLANHSGTCIELSLLYAGACEAVGLEPIVVLIPGHVFPVVRFDVRDQSGQVKETLFYAVESTKIGKLSFQDALKIGNEEFKQAVSKDGKAVFTPVKVMRSRGVYPLDLPAVEADWLNKVCPPEKMKTMARQTSRQSLVGTWRCRYRVGDEIVTQVTTLNADGTLQGYAQNQYGGRVEFHGTYRYADGIYTAETNVRNVQARVEWIDANRVKFTSAEGTVILYRVG
jgi:hypothetical protein